MHATPATSLLVAALVMLRQPCARSQAAARFLLERAAGHASLSPAEREACLDLAETIDAELPAQFTPRPQESPSASPDLQPESQADTWLRPVQARHADSCGIFS
ncbi:MAG: hypothetical protein ACK4SR_10925 [Thiobacillus sp.]